MSVNTSVPYWRLSSFYFFYFALLGCISPYWGLFLDDKGFSAQEIGELMALFGLVRILAPNVWGVLGDYTGQRMPLLRIGCAICFCIFLNIFWVQSFLWMALIMIGYGFFWAAVLPQFEVVTLNYLQDQTDQYSKIRTWGSIGFIIFVALLGWAFDYISVSFLPVFMLVLLAAIFFSSTLVKGRELTHEHESTEGFLSLILKPTVVAFLLASFLNQVSHGAYYTFFSLYLEQFGYSKSMIGFLWALGVIAEVIVFLIAHRIFAKVDHKTVLVMSLLLGGLRWIVTAHYVETLWLLALVQLLHAVTFGAMHAVAMHYIHLYFKGKHQGQGQALFSSLTYGAGGALGAYVSGLVWMQDMGVTMFEWAGYSALLGALVAWLWVNKENKLQ
ncbi:MAG: PPP family 3-phenylpropionic acid transporter [Oceanicoccus sp.]|jgi:PPP family 3-phenylpropionic acid transporter